MTDAAQGAALSAQITVPRSGFDVSVRLETHAGGCLAVLGPNGAGKSTLLAALAGLVPLCDGEINVDGQQLEQAGRLRVPAQHRRITLLDQKPRLFPHLSVVQNLAFGPRARGWKRAEVGRIVRGWLEHVDLVDLADAKPHELSGGQQQRVALARAFAAEPRVLLLDEPFAALDPASAPLVRRLLSQELARTGTTSVLVTHELADAWQWADRCLVLDRGRAIEHASPVELALRPRHPFTAALAGFGVLRGTWRSDSLVVDGAVLPGTAEQPLPDGAAAYGIVAPADVAVSASTGAMRTRLESVSIRAGTVRLDSTAGVAAELSIDDTLQITGGRFPASGDHFWFTPRSLRVLAASPDQCRASTPSTCRLR